jgi:hypothetical protein
VRVILASGRGLLSGWIIAMTVPLLMSAHAIEASSYAGLGDASRIGLARVELLGAVLFAFEVPVAAGSRTLRRPSSRGTMVARGVCYRRSGPAVPNAPRHARKRNT